MPVSYAAVVGANNFFCHTKSQTEMFMIGVGLFCAVKPVKNTLLFPVGNGRTCIGNAKGDPVRAGLHQKKENRTVFRSIRNFIVK